MPDEPSDLHGSAPDTSPVALLLIDVINDLDFDEGERLLEHARPMAGRIAELKRKARAAGVPVVYVNDNFGRWRSDFGATVEHCLEAGCLGRPVVEALRPEPEDFFVLKPMHSGFYSTVLELLLRHLGARTLVLTGMAGNICVLFTANDAHMRGYRLVIPGDAVASNTAEANDAALALMADTLSADTRPAAEVDFAAFAREE